MAKAHAVVIIGHSTINAQSSTANPFPWNSEVVVSIHSAFTSFKDLGNPVSLPDTKFVNVHKKHTVAEYIHRGFILLVQCYLPTDGFPWTLGLFRARPHIRRSDTQTDRSARITSVYGLVSGSLGRDTRRRLCNVRMAVVSPFSWAGIAKALRDLYSPYSEWKIRSTTLCIASNYEPVNTLRPLWTC